MRATLVIIPTFNESQNIKPLIEQIFSIFPEIAILIVDDNSPDQTANIVESMQFDFPLLHLLKRGQKNGIGPAYIDGFKWALEKEFEWIFQMDADFSHSPQELKMLRASAKNNSFVIGSRYIEGGAVVGWPKKRLWLSQCANLYSRYITGLHIADLTAGFNLIPLTLLKKIDFQSFRSNGYAFQIELKYNAHQIGAQLVEVPITFTERSRGESKMGKEIILEAIWSVFKLKF